MVCNACIYHRHTFSHLDHLALLRLVFINVCPIHTMHGTRRPWACEQIISSTHEEVITLPDDQFAMVTCKMCHSTGVRSKSVHYYPVGFSVCWWDEVRHDIAILHATKGHILCWWLRKYLTYNSHHQTGNMTSAPLVGIRSWHSVSSISIYSFVHIHF